MMLRPGQELAEAEGASSRLSVCGETDRRKSSHSHWPRSHSRQPATPWIAGIGPLSIWAASDWRCMSLSSGIGPGALRSIIASGPSALQRTALDAVRPTQDDLQRDVTEPRRLRARAPVVDRRKRQQVTGLGGVLAPPRQAPQLGGAAVGMRIPTQSGR